MRNLLDPIKNPTMILSTLLSVPTVSFEVSSNRGVPLNFTQMLFPEDLNIDRDPFQVRVSVRSVHGVAMHSPRSPEAVTVAF